MKYSIDFCSKKKAYMQLYEKLINSVYKYGDKLPSKRLLSDETMTSVISEAFPFSVFAKTMRNVISKYGEQILIKSPNSGCYELRKAISDYLARGKGIAVTPEQIVIGSGAEYLYGLIVQFLGREKIYAIENPSY